MRKVIIWPKRIKKREPLKEQDTKQKGRERERETAVIRRHPSLVKHADKKNRTNFRIVV